MPEPYTDLKGTGDAWAKTATRRACHAPGSIERLNASQWRLGPHCTSTSTQDPKSKRGLSVTGHASCGQDQRSPSKANVVPRTCASSARERHLFTHVAAIAVANAVSKT
jgi:hypothetical protein